MGDQKLLDRRGFLKGSALLAVAGLAVAVPAAAQNPPAPETPPDQSPAKPAPETPRKDEPKPDEKKKSVLLDKNGREYRVCDMCGGNMYLEDRRWTCDQCGFSYEV